MRLRIDLSDYLQLKTLLLAALLILMVTSVALQFVALQAVFILYCLGLFVLYNRGIDYLAASDKNYLVFALVATAAILPINVFRTPTSALHFAMVLATLGGALVAAKSPRVYAAASLVALLFAQGVVLWFLRKSGLDNFPLEDMIEGTSSNGITSYIVCLQINYCVANLHARGRAAPLTSAITFLICVVGYGRGSILAGTAIMLISLLFAFRPLPRIYAIATTAVLALGSAFLIAENYQLIYDYAANNTKLGNGLYDEPRAAMIEEYWNRLSGFNILFGASFDNTLIDRFFNGNPHNSYIRGHHFLGLFYILLMGLMVLRPLFSRISITEKAFHIAMLGTLLLRASTEPILFPTPFDVMYFSMFLLFGRPSQASLARRPASLPSPKPAYA
ncbi:hypothetical protein FHR20_000561 [Sphingomonas leidyi]|uniref:O-antigen ligase family protein n=1 Tax=Sphingomonas leidyi TaxID=68569 RepID=A0A7X5ZU43_9SPHN|nr:hypothetical protein [Sphingomonas leidyi]NIJ63630.1 hypothetical protein [Sphingomonas leidyi]